MKKLIPLLLCILLLSGCAATYDGPTQTRRVCTLMETEVFNADGTHSQWHRVEYNYDIYGNLSQVVDSYDGSPSTKTVLTYDKAGREIRHVQYSLSGWIPKRLVDVRYTYDNLGRLVSTRHHAGGLTWDNDTTVYDDEAMTRTYTGYDGTVIDYLNDQGWVLRSEQTFPDGRTVLTEFDRRPDGQPLCIRTWEGGVITDETLYTYDEEGRILTHTQIRDGISTLLYAWEYGEDSETMFYSDGSNSTVVYHEDGTTKSQYHTDANGRLVSKTIYEYTEIQVPAKEGTP